MIKVKEFVAGLFGYKRVAKDCWDIPEVHLPKVLELEAVMSKESSTLNRKAFWDFIGVVCPFDTKRPIYFKFTISADTYQIREGGPEDWKDGFKWVKKSEK